MSYESKLAELRRAPASFPSSRAPDQTTPLRRPSDDPTLGDGNKPQTTRGWAPTPTLTDRRELEGPAFVVDLGHRQDSGARVAEGLERLGRPVELLTRTAPGGTAAVPATGTGRPQVVHVGSASAVSEPAVARTVAAYRPGATITYDPGILPDVMGSPDEVRRRVAGLVAQADVVKVSRRDLQWLYPDDEPRVTVRRWLSSGPGIIVVSASDEGAWAMNGTGLVATSTGATFDDGAPGVGEAFMAGVIDALWKAGLLGVWSRADLRTLVWGSLQELVDNAAAAAGVAFGAGGQPPTRAELDAARGFPQIGAPAAS